MTADHERHTGRRELPQEIVRPPIGRRRGGRNLDRYERRMARALASVINVLDPDVIVLGGGMSKIDRLYADVPRLWGEWVFAATKTTASSQRPIPKSHGSSSNSSDDERLGVATLAVGSFEIRTRLARAKHGDSSGVRGAAGLWQ